MKVDGLRQISMCASNYQEVNFNANHREFSAGLVAYWKCLENLGDEMEIKTW